MRQEHVFLRGEIVVIVVVVVRTTEKEVVVVVVVDNSEDEVVVVVNPGENVVCDGKEVVVSDGGEVDLVLVVLGAAVCCNEAVLFHQKTENDKEEKGHVGETREENYEKATHLAH